MWKLNRCIMLSLLPLMFLPIALLIVLFEFVLREIKQPIDYPIEPAKKTLKDFVDWRLLSANPSAVPFLEMNLDKVNWNWLSLNPNAIHLLEANPEKINWMYLSTNPKAIHLLEAHPERINWTFILQNYNAIHLIEKYREKVNWNEVTYMVQP